MPSNHFTETFATIAVKAAKYLGGSFTNKAAIDFAWWSVNEPGDASLPDDECGDFGRHIRAWLAEVDEAGLLSGYRVHG